MPDKQKQQNYTLGYYADSATLHGVRGIIHSPYLGTKILWGVCLLVALFFGAREIYRTGKVYADYPTMQEVRTTEEKFVPSISVCAARGYAMGLPGNFWHPRTIGNCSATPNPTADLGVLSYIFMTNHYAHHMSTIKDPGALIKSLDRNNKEPGMCEVPVDPTTQDSLNATLDLQVWTDKYSPGNNISDCLKTAYEETFKAHKYEALMVSKSWYMPERENLQYFSPSESFLLASNVSHRFLDDKASGICATYEWPGQVLDPQGYFYMKPAQVQARFYGFFVNQARLTPEYIHLGVWGHQLYSLNIQSTKFVRIKNCVNDEHTKSHEIRRKECLSERMLDTVGCCFCGNAGNVCPIDARCCSFSHICEALRAEGFKDAWAQCDNLEPPCAESKYTTTLTMSYYVDPLVQLPQPTPTINIVFQNSDAIVTIAEIPRYNVEQVLGTLGGILGLFVGGSLLSIVEIIIFLIGKCMSKYYTVSKIKTTPIISSVLPGLEKAESDKMAMKKG